MSVFLTLSLSWLLSGILIGLLAYAAKWRPMHWGRYSWLKLSAVGALIALLVGWLGLLLLGKAFATPTALWVAVLGVVFLPKMAVRPFSFQRKITHR
jgi:multisubunit Na+/H+ antiporter MnhB subunit